MVGGSVTEEKIEYQKYKKTKSFKAQRATNKGKQKGAVPPFVRFQKEERTERAEEYRKMGLYAATKEISEKWRRMSKEAKQKYIDEYKQERKVAR
jgi:hypothetical protein